MRRQGFEFVFSAQALRDAAEERFAYHNDHYIDWTVKRTQAEEDLKTFGVEFREHQITGGTTIDIVGDPERVRWLTCNAKVAHHQALCDEYERWFRAFDIVCDRLENEGSPLNQDHLFVLDVDDVAYFKL